MESVPPNAPARKRPWYLVLAILAAWLFGARGMADGWEKIDFYRSTPSVEEPQIIADIADDATRAHVIEARDGFIAAMDVARPRVFPLGVASFVLGIAMWIVAGSAMVGRKGARNVLVQLALAQALLIGVEYAATHDVRVHEEELALRFAETRIPATGDEAQRVRTEKLMAAAAHIEPPLMLALQIVARGLLVVAMTRPRTRQFFEAAPQSTEN